jgi:serine/threonine-protein kinase
MTNDAASTSRQSTIDTEFLGARVRLFLKVLFLIHVGFMVLSAVQLGLGWSLPGASQPTAAQHLIEWGLTGGLGAGWWAVARGCPTGRVLHSIDAVIPPVLGLLYVPIVGGTGVPEAGLIILVLVSLALVLRAALVPSTIRRTVVVGAVGIVIATIGAAWIPSDREPLQLIWVIALGGAFVTVTAVTSSVIYDLRREVRAATRLGQYELTRKLGEGGMGVVYEATHLLLRRPTAVKLLPVEKAGEESVARFEREVRHTSRLEHPNNVSIYDYGRTPDGQFYYAMEYLRGLNLDQLVRGYGPLGEARVVHILTQTARALAEAHGKALVHRDVKPSNIMVCDRGGVPDTVKVLDFGLVKSARDGLGETARTLVVTQATTVVGTPHYLAPEAIRGESVGPPADVYALGDVGYFLLSGREVFSGMTPIEVLAQHLNTDPPSPSEFLGRPLSRELDTLLERCLEKDPNRRFRDGREMAETLGSLADVACWGEAEARVWWDEHESDMPSEGGESRGPRTQIAIDVEARRDAERVGRDISHGPDSTR